MKYFISIFLASIVFLTEGCGFKEREQQLARREEMLDARAQELMIREKNLQVREQEIANKERFLDSTQFDSTFIYNPDLVGSWYVKMNCTETTCPGSAVGDTKTEIWDIQYNERLVVAKVMESNKLTRIYTGYYTGDMLQLTFEGFDTNPDKTTTMTVQLKFTGNGQLEGQREIRRPEDCYIIYNLKLNKQP